MSPELSGGFLTTRPPGKPYIFFWLGAVGWNRTIFVVWYIILGLYETISLNELEEKNPFWLWVLPGYLEKRVIISLDLLEEK